MADALEFVISMNVENSETARGVGVNDVGEAGEHGIAAPVSDGEHGAVIEVTGNGVEKW